jgi:hypothetical protein
MNQTADTAEPIPLGSGSRHLLVTIVWAILGVELAVYLVALPIAVLNLAVIARTAVGQNFFICFYSFNFYILLLHCN